MDPPVPAEVLRNTLDNLTKDDFERFKHYLKDQERIKWGKLEKADIGHTVDLMVQVYTSGAESIALSILRKMNQNRLADCLERDLGKCLAREDDRVNTVTADSEMVVDGPHRRKSMDTPLTFNENTAQKNLTLSKDNKMVTYGWGDNPYPPHPDRFLDSNSQVLCNEGLSGRCDWEVKWVNAAFIGVAYKGMGRDEDCVLGTNGMSWCLAFSDEDCFAWHKNVPTEIPVKDLQSNTVRVSLDSEAGTLAFFCVCPDKLIPLHTFKARFTEPLYPAFRLNVVDASVSLT